MARGCGLRTRRLSDAQRLVGRAPKHQIKIRQPNPPTTTRVDSVSNLNGLRGETASPRHGPHTSPHDE
ncbi:hypothetical protein HPP92_006645 [Vanilla planifolia]|uniref:Uncharacterized protein n=1 Tax=Vanilla planifolia TaxID=51239 RepID=A0A835RPR6_VANPL|nr:hypothetical protein HPP92_006645 [Vanilla planifolia]